ncbi:hypothetical protein [Arachidicoccus soli]|uniref:Uncharacterized protein n=1 Tax=Arachidicoccus soli TaxID=2341117 RepID=A0A386HTQ5_9BACT|nr:hypothetical protein [Arachidicoccus soli]AYD49062.1 hypothetical protein D6B99_16425 [Arachidicoccus soli]
MNDYKRTLEEFRTFYKTRYDVTLDDEILYFIVRVNEMQVSLKKEITSIPKLTFKSGKDYFMFGLGKTILPAAIFLIVCIVIIWLVSNSISGEHLHSSVVMKSHIPFLKIVSDSSEYLMPLQKK